MPKRSLRAKATAKQNPEKKRMRSDVNLQWDDENVHSDEDSDDEKKRRDGGSDEDNEEEEISAEQKRKM
jgi:hypothetical protein